MTTPPADQTGNSTPADHIRVLAEMLERHPGWKCSIADLVGTASELISGQHRHVFIDESWAAADRAAAIAHVFAHIDLGHLSRSPNRDKFTPEEEAEADDAVRLYLGRYTADDFHPF